MCKERRGRKGTQSLSAILRAASLYVEEDEVQ